MFLVPLKWCSVMLDKHFLLQLASTAGMIPLAAANAPALIKFRKCVTGDKIVFAICDVAFGYKNKFYIHA